ncbi:MAG: histidine kinase [Terracidiphilus sp.]|nr:histidine kinase [Terracidiphilus sp.]MDR3775996.1 histidine kinase [Terracidiphilus sp.]
MICETIQPVSNLPGIPRRKRNYTAYLFRVLWITLSVTLLIVLLFLSIGRIRLSDTGRQFLIAYIYCILISLPSIAIVTVISMRYTDKFPRLIILMQAAVMASTAVAGSLAAGLVFQVTGLVAQGRYWPEFRSTVPFCIVISLAVGLSISTFETLRYKFQAAQLELRTRQVEQERAYKLLAEAQLSSLESRIRPHFLFNTLNSIAALIPSDPVRAEDTVGKLASLLRFSLNANHSSLVPLSQELKIVRDYLEIEKTRFGQRLRYEIAVPDALADVKTPPLALQSLVENVVKHVVSERQQGATIQIAGSLVGPDDTRRIQLEVCDDGPGFSLDAITPEHGLGNLVARLDLLFGGAGQLEVTRENEKTVVRLSFPASS